MRLISAKLRDGLTVLIVAMPLFMSGCKGFWNPHVSTAHKEKSGAFYVLNRSRHQVAGFTIDSETVRPLSGSPYPVNSPPLAIAASPNGSFIYVSSVTGIFVYVVGRDGSLRLGNNGAVISPDPAQYMEVDSSGSWLVEGNSATGSITALPLDFSSGMPPDGSSADVVALPSSDIEQLALTSSDSLNRYVFVAMGADGTAVIPFAANTAAPFGAIKQIPCLSSQGGAYAVSVDKKSRLLLIGETSAEPGTQSAGVRVFTIGSELKELPDSPYRIGGTSPSAILATDYFVYIANRSVSGTDRGSIAQFAITRTGLQYSLTPLDSPAQAGSNTAGIAEDNTSTYVIAVNSGGNPDFNTYVIDSSMDGKLTALTTGSIGAGKNQASAIVALP